MGFSFSVSWTPVFRQKKRASTNQSVCVWEKFFEAKTPTGFQTEYCVSICTVSAVHFSAEQWRIKLNRVVLTQTAVSHLLDVTIF